MTGGTGRWLMGAIMTIAIGIGAAGAQDSPSTPAAAPTVMGTISGVVLDKVSGDPVIEAGVEVVGTGKKTRTDIDGKYSIKVPPGVYEVRIFAPLYQGTRIQKVSVRPNESSKADVALASAGKGGVEVVEVVAQAKKAAEATQLLKRQKAATVSDTVSAETIAKSPDSNAGEVVKRIPAVTIKGDKFVFVRGLGERYSSAVLNGSRLPSPDPDRRIVPLDLFPSDFIDAIDVTKSYTPDLPGDFSAGLVGIDLRDHPDQLKYSLGLSTGANTSTTSKRFRTYKGSNIDQFGFGRFYRDLPSDFPSDTQTLQAPTPAQQSFYASQLPNIWSPRSDIAPPNYGVNMSVGDKFGPFGFSLGGLYTTEYQTVRNEIVRQFQSTGDPSKPSLAEHPDDFSVNTSTFKTTLGGVFTSSYELTPNHRVSFRSLIDRNTADEVSEGVGTTNQNPAPDVTTATSLTYKDEELDFGQLVGDHHFGFFDVEWRTAYARTTQDQPDGRITTYILNPEQPPARLTRDGNGGLRYFSNLQERMTDSAVDFTIPFRTALPFTDVWSGLPAKFKFGPAYTYRDRNFNIRRFQYDASGNLTELAPPELAYDPANIGPNLRFYETTAASDSFSATQEIIGGYGMFDLPLVANRLRLIVGVREEYSLITLHTVDAQTNPLKIQKLNVDPLPGANLVYTPRYDMNVRFGYSQTVSRPDFREQTPVLFPAVRFDRNQLGNPDLVQTSIESFDLRWEWFFAPGELVSLGGFSKTLDKPIERTVQGFASQNVESFANAQDGDEQGFEFEGRKNFGFIRPSLTYLSLMTNAAYISSNVHAPKTSPTEQQTSTQRPLQGQAPFVINAAIDYTHPEWGTVRLLYNTVGPRIDAIGVYGLPNIYEERRDQLDFVLIAPLKRFGAPNLTAKFAVENILNAPVTFTQLTAIQDRHVTGTKFSLGISYAY